MQPDIYENDSDNIKNVNNPIIVEEGLYDQVDPLALEIKDEDLIKIVDKRIEDSKKFWNGDKINLKARREKMEKALFGRQISDKERNKELKDYETRYSNNALYEIEATIKPVAMSHLPDLIVSPGNDTPESQKSAEDISKAVNDDIKKRQNRTVLGMAFKHLPVYLIGIIKVRWNPELNDYEFYCVHPENIVLDKTATSTNVDDMDIVPELLTMTVQQALMRFPSKRKELFDELKKGGLTTGDNDFNWKDLASEIKIWEVWFTWYINKNDKTDIKTDQPAGEQKDSWERVEGVLWKYEKLILKKTKNPNYDYEGQEQYFTYDDPSNANTKRAVTPQEMVMPMLTGQLPPNVQQETTYFNYFDMPKKPYFFMGYDQWGKTAIDETSRIEQNMYSQENLNSMGKQVIETLKQRVKHIWSTDSSLTAEDVQNLDMENPKLDALVDGNVNDVHSAISPERPDAAQFNALNAAKSDMFALAGATSLTGQIQTDVATTNQIAREQNFTRVDDLVEDTINAASEWMARWAMQFIKLRYTEEKMRKLFGKSGQFTFLNLKRDKIEDGMEVLMKASGTDKLKAQRNAMDMAKLGPPYVNPIDFFKDMDISDPEGRAERGMMLMTDPSGYVTKYILGLDTTQQIGDTLNGPGTTPASGQLASAQPLPVPTSGGAGLPPSPSPVGMTTPAQNPTPMDTSNISTTQPTFPTGSVRGG